MNKRLILGFLGLLLISVFFVGCTSQKQVENLLNPDSVQALSSSAVSVSTTAKIPVSTVSTIKTNEPPKKSIWFNLAQNETGYHNFDENTSYELSLGNITIQQYETSDTKSAYSIKINITAKNTGNLPLRPTILVESLKGTSGDGCSYNMPTWCGVLDFGKINPGESKTGTTNVTFFSTKDYVNLSSQKYLFEIGIQGERIGWNLNSWSIDLKKSN